MRNTDWHEYDEGFSVGTVGAQDGAIIRDEEHDEGARLTLEEDASAALRVHRRGRHERVLRVRGAAISGAEGAVERGIEGLTEG